MGSRTVDGVREIFVGRLRRRCGFLHLKRAAAGKHEEVNRSREAVRLLRIVAVHPFGIGADRIDQHFAPDPISTGDGHWKAGERHEGIHKAGAALAPHPGNVSRRQRAVSSPFLGKNERAQDHCASLEDRMEKTATSANKLGSRRASRLPLTKISRSIVQLCSRQSTRKSWMVRKCRLGESCQGYG